MAGIVIEQYTDSYQQAVQRLILGIQRDEFQIDIDLEMQPDLRDISNFYQRDSGNFWIAKSGDEVIGCVAVIDIGSRHFALRKMFVDERFRGREFNTGQKLLDTAIEHAKGMGIETIYLGTTEKFLAAQRFYEKNGFHAIDKGALPAHFPVMSVDVKFYVLNL